MKSVFKIQDLHCAYQHNANVLHIEALDIPLGKLVFIVGRSGIGKSTMLELLGLMNDPFVRNVSSNVEFSDREGNVTEILKLWESEDAVCSAFRRRHYSFMFQQTNLMPNFTCGENMMMSMLISGINMQTARENVLQAMDQLSLPRSIFDKPVNEISGGQRQRLAFVRAVTSDFTVLFGDEPTGNLDRESAHEIMSVLSSLVHQQQKSCIIVSHDLELAQIFADVVIPISGKALPDGGFSGEISSDNVLYKSEQQWTNNRGELVLEHNSVLADCLKTNNILVRA
jgi:ABC-type lipoprotein export system ATPase subunit